MLEKQVNITIFQSETIVCLEIERSPFDEKLLKYFKDHLRYFHKKESCICVLSEEGILLVGTDFLYAEIEKFFNGEVKIVYSKGSNVDELFEKISLITNFIRESDFGWELNSGSL